MADMRHPGNRLSEDAHFHYQYDQYGNLNQKISKRDAGEVHHYRYDRSHRLVSYICYQDGEALRGGRYCYDPLGRRIGKQLMHRDQPKHISWFGWDGDKLVLTERDGTRIHTVYLPRSFVPLLRFEGDKPPTVIPLADKLEQEAGITLPPDFKQALHHIEQALRTNHLSTEQHAWLNQVQLSPDYLETLLDPLPDTPYAAQLYDCNHLGTPQQLINLNGHIDWSITLDAWGNELSEENPHQLHQPIRMQGQQYDEESGLHYNRHRYYDPTIGRYITQDPIGLRGGLNFYGYPAGPVSGVDPLGLASCLYSISTGILGCVADSTHNNDVFIPVASGNNGGGNHCKNNPTCTNQSNRGPIPIGGWHWNNNRQSTKPNGRVLQPDDGTDTHGRDSFRTHSCLNAFGPSIKAPFCSEGCITGYSIDIRKLNELLDSEPNSELTVTE